MQRKKKRRKGEKQKRKKKHKGRMRKRRTKKEEDEEEEGEERRRRGIQCDRSQRNTYISVRVAQTPCHIREGWRGDQGSLAPCVQYPS